MWRVEKLWGSDIVDKIFFVFLRPFAYFYPKQKRTILNTYNKSFLKIKKNLNVDKGGWIITKFYNIIIKFANVDKGLGIKRLSTKSG